MSGSFEADVKAVTITETGTVVAGPARVKGVYMSMDPTTGGGVVFTDGGSGGTERLTLTTPATATANPIWVDFAQYGIRFKTDVYATMTNVDSITVVYSG